MPRPLWTALAAAGLLVVAGCATPAPEDPQASAPGVETVLDTAETILGQPIAYPTGSAAHVTAAIITLPPGASTGWHRHQVPLFGYMLEGELTVDYRGQGQRLYRSGDSLMEAIGTAHDGHNAGPAPVRILAVFMGAEGVPNTEKVD